MAKEGKVLEQKKLLQPLLGTPEGTEMGCIIFFFTSSTMTVYSNIQFVKSGQKFGQGPPPPSFGQNPKEQLFFSGDRPKDGLIKMNKKPVSIFTFIFVSEQLKGTKIPAKLLFQIPAEE